eukprot:2462306-Pyramimonas_sp.AAC.1
MVKTNCSTHMLEAPTWNSTMWQTELFRVARARARARHQMRIQSSHLNLECSMVKTTWFTHILEASTQKHAMWHT